MKPNQYKIKEKVWLYPGATPWHFVSVPKKQAGEIKKKFGSNRRGFGSLPVSVTIGKTKWKTSIFPEKKMGEYFLPLKAEVRKKEGIMNGDIIRFIIEIRP
ncbi:MAG: DUF1905 domain-containing protein [Parcubacteria group bacterium]|nr:DUF1905 domain-containing protein [Parcubacteria group bacterium]